MILDIESVSALRIRLVMVSYESVSKIREFESIADLEIFALESRSERMRFMREGVWPRICVIEKFCEISR